VFYARAKRLVQHLSIGRIAAEIGNNESLGIIVAVNRREIASARTPIRSLRELVGLLSLSIRCCSLVRSELSMDRQPDALMSS
jgi:hypothetical protein